MTTPAIPLPPPGRATVRPPRVSRPAMEAAHGAIAGGGEDAGAVGGDRRPYRRSVERVADLRRPLGGDGKNRRLAARASMMEEAGRKRRGDDEEEGDPAQ